MANNVKKTSDSKKSTRAASGVVFLIAVLVLIAALVFLYVRNRNRKAEFFALQAAAAQSEELFELEPRAAEETEAK